MRLRKIPRNLLRAFAGYGKIERMNKNTRKLTADELKTVLQKHYRQFIVDVSFRVNADGRLYVAVEFADNGESDAPGFVAHGGR